MAWDIGGVTLAIDEEPDDGALNFVQAQIWLRRIPLGPTGVTLKQRLSVGAAEPHRLHFNLSEATKNAIEALYAIGDPVTLTVDGVDPFDAGVTVTITEMTAQWNSNVRGLPWYDVWLTLEE